MSSRLEANFNPRDELLPQVRTLTLREDYVLVVEGQKKKATKAVLKSISKSELST
jgi:hypothetical protein